MQVMAEGAAIAEAPKVLWEPSKEEMENSNLAALIRFVEARRPDLNFGEYGEECYQKFHQWSVNNLPEFSSDVLDFFDIPMDKGHEVLSNPDNMEKARYFEDTQLSFAEVMLRRVQDAPDEPALISRVQGGEDRVISWQQLYDETSRWQQALKAAGVGEGDRVAVNLPNVPETVPVMLATANLGAIYSSTGTELPADALISRFGQIDPKVLVAADGQVFGDKTQDRQDVIAEVQQAVPSIQKTVVLPFSGDFNSDPAGELKDAVSMEEFLQPYSADNIDFERRPFNTPLYILFSSGTTGKPKCFLHSAGGTLFKHMVESQLQTDVKPGESVFYNTTPSWMMWQWLVGNLASQATVLMYHGHPMHPDIDAQWDFTSKHNCAHHGTAAPLVLNWEKAGLNIDHLDTSSLRSIMTTGDILPPQSFEFLGQMAPGVKIASISGGSDIDGCWILGNPFASTKVGRIDGPVLGSDIQIVDENTGLAVPVGTSGELICTTPVPSVLGFWNDTDGSKYHEAYYQEFEGKISQPVWHHGDLISMHGRGIEHHGRSDSVLNQNGLKKSPSEIYAALSQMKTIQNMAAVNFQRPDNQQAMTVLFVQPSQEGGVNDDMRAEIKRTISKRVDPGAAPRVVIEVPNILQTPNGKKAEKVMKKILAGATLSDEDAALYGGAQLAQVYEGISQDLHQKYPAPAVGGEEPSEPAA